MADAEDMSLPARYRLKLVPPITQDTIPPYRRIVQTAKRGLNEPSSLTRQDIEQLCAALVDHYAQMGID